VEGLVKLLITSRDQYADLVERAKPINEKLLFEKGIWHVNMQKVEKLYLQLLKDE
jgi:hypothetical protein